jgi:hypothetical protein
MSRAERRALVAKDPIQAIYDRYTYLDEMREALEKWEATLTGLLNRPA